MKKKTLYYVILFILIISLLAIKVYAASSFTTTLTPSSTSVSADTEVVVTVAVSNLNIDGGISGFTAYLDYDTDVFETLTDSSVEGLNDWLVTYSTSSGKIALVRTSFVTEDQDIMQITLRVKSDAEEGAEGTVTLSNVVVTNNDEDITGSNVSTTITVGEESSSGNTANNVTGNTVINITANTVTNNSENANTNNATTNTNVITNNGASSYNISTNTSDDDMPYTGSDSGAIAKIILGVVFISLVIYIKFKRIDEDVK